MAALRVECRNSKLLSGATSPLIGLRLQAKRSRSCCHTFNGIGNFSTELALSLCGPLNWTGCFSQEWWLCYVAAPVFTPWWHWLCHLVAWVLLRFFTSHKECMAIQELLWCDQTFSICWWLVTHLGDVLGNWKVIDIRFWLLLLCSRMNEVVRTSVKLLQLNTAQQCQTIRWLSQQQSNGLEHSAMAIRSNQKILALKTMQINRNDGCKQVQNTWVCNFGSVQEDFKFLSCVLEQGIKCLLKGMLWSDDKITCPFEDFVSHEHALPPGPIRNDHSSHWKSLFDFLERNLKVRRMEHFFEPTATKEKFRTRCDKCKIVLKDWASCFFMKEGGVEEALKRAVSTWAWVTSWCKINWKGTSSDKDGPKTAQNKKRQMTIDCKQILKENA